MRSRGQKAHFCKRKKSDRHTEPLRTELLQRFTGGPKGRNSNSNIFCYIPHKNKLTNINTSTFILIEGTMLREREWSGKQHQYLSLDIWGKEHYYIQLEAWAEI